jgi:hypothetical protein
MALNKKKLYRLYREEGLAVHRRRGRKRATGTRTSMILPGGHPALEPRFRRRHTAIPNPVHC